MASGPEGDPELERQRAGIEAAFRERWLPPDADQPRVLTVPAWAEARKIIERGGGTSLDPATLQAVRDGAQPGDSLPPRQPAHYTGHVTDAEVIITGSGPGRLVAVVFSHQHFPGIRFGHRFHPSWGSREYFSLMEDIETGGLHRMMETGPSADAADIIWTAWGARTPGLQQQRAEIAAAFREGWRPAGAGQPRVLTEHAYAQARNVLGRGGWTGLDPATIQAVRDGAQPGDPLPPLQPDPFIDRVADAEVTITGSGPGRRVAVLFTHRDFPGVRFGHRFPLDPHAEGREQIWLKEEIETGALHRMMNSRTAPDDAGITWTTWGSPGPD